MKNLYEFYRSRCDKYSEEVLFDRTISYGRAFELAMARAAFLQEQGLGAGDVIGILAPGSAEWCITYMAITAIGGIVLPLDTGIPGESCVKMAITVDTRAVFLSPEFRDHIKGVPQFDISMKSSIGDAGDVVIPDITEEHIASLVFTSGTTGSPKIVSLTHRNIFRTAIATSEYLELTTRDLLLCILPLFHVYALDANFIGPFAAGSSLVFQPSLKGPDIMKSLSENPVTIFPAAPQLWELFADGIINRVRAGSKVTYRLFMFFLKAAPVLQAVGLSWLTKRVFGQVHDIFGRDHRFFISGGAPLKEKYARIYRNMGFTLIEGYGLSETTGPITLPDYRNNVLGSVGKPTPGNHVRMKNINKEGIGEIWLGGDSVMAGYYRNDEANREAFDEDGFFNTGDLGRLDSMGNIFITGRFKNVIVLDSGKNVYPEELESWYRQSDLISEIAVFGRRENGREEVFAVVVPARKTGNPYPEIREELALLGQGLPAYKRVRRFALSLEPLPVNSTRKVLYSEVRRLLDQGYYQLNENDTMVFRNRLMGSSPAEEEIVDLLKKKLDTDELYSSQTLDDLGIDSHGLIELIVHIEEGAGVSIDTGRFKGLQTLEEIIQYVAGIECERSETIDSRIFSGEIEIKPHRIFNPMHHVLLDAAGYFSRKMWNLHTLNRERFEINNNIIIANHQSYLDIIWIAAELPRKYRRDIYVTGKKKLSFLRFFFPVLPIIFIDNNNTLDVLKASADILRQGKSLVIFPEGTRSRDGSLNSFKTGAAYLAKNLGIPVLPVTINGSYEIYPPHRRLPRLRRSLNGHLVPGEIIDPSDFNSVEELNAELYRAIDRQRLKN